jgi:acetyl-CoA synthetase
MSRLKGSYKNVYEESLKNREKFWMEQAEELHWFEKPTNILTQNDKGHYRWFEGGKLNTCYLALDYHVENGRADQTALVYDSPVTGTITKYSFRRLLDEVSKFAGALKNLGVEKGDTVIIYMPMIPEAVISMLACARIGAIHSVVFGGFAPHELAIRINDAKPKVIISATCGIEVNKVIEYKPLLDRAIEEAVHKPEKVVIAQRQTCSAKLDPNYELNYNDIMGASEPVPCEVLDATDPLYILYTSGTTGVPKGIVRDNGGHAVALKYSMNDIYGVNPGEVYWAASDVGWVVGHSYIVYAPLIHGCTTVLYEGKPIRTPDAGAFWRVIEDHKVNVLFTAPTAIRAIKKEDPEGKLLGEYDVSSLRTLFLAGERCNPETYYWSHEKLGVPVIDHWWQTETGWPIVANMMGLEPVKVKAGSATRPVPGYQVEILDEEGKQVGANKKGFIAVKLPLPPGCLPTLWNDDSRFERSYLSMFDGYYATGDGGYIDEDGYVFIMGRVDDVINVAGHRLSTGEMEEVIMGCKEVAECAVIAHDDELRGQVPLAIIVLKNNVNHSEKEIRERIIGMIREKIGAIAYLKNVVFAERLPKTRSGKILRSTMRNIANGQEYRVPSTIDDPGILEDITLIFQKDNLVHKDVLK